MGIQANPKSVAVKNVKKTACLPLGTECQLTCSRMRRCSDVYITDEEDIGVKPRAKGGAQPRRVLCKYRKDVIDNDEILFSQLMNFVRPSTMRKTCGSIVSGVVGYMDTWSPTQIHRMNRMNIPKQDRPLIRPSTFMIDHSMVRMNKFAKSVDNLFANLYPDKHKWQKKLVKKSGFSIAGTAFTTVQVNLNATLGVHVDANNLKGGMCLIVLLGANQNDTYRGGELKIPEYGLCVKLNIGDVILLDNSEKHCTTPVTDGVRMSLVFYARHNVVHEGTKYKRKDVIEFYKHYFR